MVKRLVVRAALIEHQGQGKMEMAAVVDRQVRARRQPTDAPQLLVWEAKVPGGGQLAGCAPDLLPADAALLEAA